VAEVAVLPGDGIGPEVTTQGLRVLTALPFEASVVELPFGGAAIDLTGEPLPPETLSACRSADAVLLGAVGGPRWDHASPRPEAGLLGIRKELDVYANLRPTTHGDVDLVIVRELVGGLYFGARGVRDDGTVFDTCEYHPTQIERVVRLALELARSRRGRLVSVDKSNVLDTSRLWRRIVEGLTPEYSDVTVSHALVDSFAIELVLHTASFDVIVTENMFGDILSDLAGGIAGGLGLAASASLGDEKPGIFEPVHGSAPDLAGRGVANPAAMLRSVALMLERAFDQGALARFVFDSVDHALQTTPTRDVGGAASTTEFGDAVLRSLEARLALDEATA